MACHSRFVDEEGVASACGCPLLPLKSNSVGLAQVLDDEGSNFMTRIKTKHFSLNFSITICVLQLRQQCNAGRADVVDEAITFFRVNVFFRNFEIKSPSDKLLIYLTFYINMSLKRLEGCRTLAEGTNAMNNLVHEKVTVPGEPGFPFPGLLPVPQSQIEADMFRNYLKQIREVASMRLLSVAYRQNGTPNKWWLAFAKRNFMKTIAP